MQIRQTIQALYQIGKVLTQVSMLFIEIDDLSGGQLSQTLSRRIGGTSSYGQEPKLRLVDIRRGIIPRASYKPHRARRGTSGLRMTR